LHSFIGIDFNYMRLFKIFFSLGIFFLSILLFSKTNRVSAQSCVGYGVCCTTSSMWCEGSSWDNVHCNIANIGEHCGFGGHCVCAVEYTRTCNSSCVSNACASGGTLIDDFCAPWPPPCSPVNGGWSSWSGTPL
jgi:hypothetical protein